MANMKEFLASLEPTFTTSGNQWLRIHSHCVDHASELLGLYGYYRGNFRAKLMQGGEEIFWGLNDPDNCSGADALPACPGVVGAH